jgi:DNA-binding NtrC family response regulator
MAHILIIDDDEQLRGFLEILLTRDGHTVKMAASGSEGIAVYHEEKFDLVITDIIMPNGRGIDVILSLQQSNDKTPIIAISGVIGKCLMPNLIWLLSHRWGLKKRLKNLLQWKN